MKEKMRFTLSALIWAVILLAAFAIAVHAQTGATDNQHTAKKGVTIQASVPNLPVQGSGTIGRLPKWTGLTSSNSFIGDSTIFEDKFGMVGIGTDAPPSKLTVMGMIQTTLGGYKFPDGTVQTTAGISLVLHDATLSGNGTAATPLGIATSGVNTIHLANNAVTAAKIANSTVARSLNGLFDNVTVAAGANITITPSGRRS